MKKNKYIIVAVALIAIYLISSWWLPFNKLSFKKEFHFNTDNVVVKQYNSNLEELQQRLSEIDVEKNGEMNGELRNSLQYVYQLAYYPLFTENEYTISLNDLQQYGFTMEETLNRVRQSIQFSDDYYNNMYLLMLTRELQDALTKIKYMSAHKTNFNRNELHEELKDIHRGNLYMTINFTTKIAENIVSTSNKK